MMKAMLAAALAPLLMLCACAGSVSPPAGPVGIPTDAIEVPATLSDRAIVLAELGYNAAMRSAVAVAKGGILKPDTPTSAELLIIEDRAYRALVLARAAKTVTEQTAALDIVRGLTQELRDLVVRH